MKSAKPLALAFGITLATLLANAAERARAIRLSAAAAATRHLSQRADARRLAGRGLRSRRTTAVRYCGGAGMIEGHIGGMLNPRLALMGDFWGGPPVGRRCGTGTTYQGIYTLAAQYWVTPILWLKGGVGFGQLQFGYDGSSDVTDESGTGLLRRPGSRCSSPTTSRSICQFRFGHGFYSTGPDVNNFAFMIGQLVTLVLTDRD